MFESNSKQARSGLTFDMFVNIDQFIGPRIIKTTFIIGAILIISEVGVGLYWGLEALVKGLNLDSPPVASYALLTIAAVIIAGCSGFLVWRIICELMLVAFKINENVQSIRDVAEQRSQVD